MPLAGLFLFLFFIKRVLFCDWIEFFKLEFCGRVLLLILAREIHMALANAFFIAN